MRVLIAPTALSGAMSAADAADAIAAGWSRQAPGDEIDVAAMADTGVGMLGALHRALGGELAAVTVRSPVGEEIPAALLVAGETAYVEAAQACGPGLAPDGDPAALSSAGVGDLVRAACASGVRRVVVGLGGSGALDGGAGMLEALGARADVPLGAGGAALAGLGSLDLTRARAALAEVELVCAHDATTVLSGLFGVAKTSGDAQNRPDAWILALDAGLEDWGRVVERRACLQSGSGAAGGLGFALGVLGARTTSGIATMLTATDLERRARAADLVLTGSARLDHTSRPGTLIAAIAETAAAAVRPCVAIAEEVVLGARESRALGFEAAYPVAGAAAGDGRRAVGLAALEACAARVARTWSR